jgi:hypothetical protein
LSQIEYLRIIFRSFLFAFLRGRAYPAFHPKAFGIDVPEVTICSLLIFLKIEAAWSLVSFYQPRLS